MKKKSISRKILEEFLDFLRVMNPENFAELGPYGQIRYKKFPRTTYYRKIYKFEKQNLPIFSNYPKLCTAVQIMGIGIDVSKGFFFLPKNVIFHSRGVCVEG